MEGLDGGLRVPLNGLTGPVFPSPPTREASRGLRAPTPAGGCAAPARVTATEAAAGKRGPYSGQRQRLAEPSRSQRGAAPGVGRKGKSSEGPRASRPDGRARKSGAPARASSRHMATRVRPPRLPTGNVATPRTRSGRKLRSHRSSTQRIPAEAEETGPRHLGSRAGVC